MGRTYEGLMPLNRAQSRRYLSPSAYAARKLNRKLFPSAKKVSKCADERMRFSDYTQALQGIIEPYRTIGGNFGLGMPYYQKLVYEWVDRNYHGDPHRECIAFLTYHWDEIDPHLGCRGFDYDVENARNHINILREQYLTAFGQDVVQPIMIGVETRTERLVLHGMNDEIFDLHDAVGMSDDDLTQKLHLLNPGIKDQVAHDIVPFLSGNIRHFQTLKHIERDILEFRHRGNILCVGRGFDWLTGKKAVIVGPYDLDMARQIETAASIIWQNWKDGVIHEEDGIVLLVSAVYWHESTEYFLAVDKALELARVACDVVSRSSEEFHQMAKMWDILVGVVDMNSRKMKRLPFKPAA